MPANHGNGLDGQTNTDHTVVNSGTPLLMKPLLKPSITSTKISLLLQDWWLWEILSAVVALLATTIIVVILVLFDGSPLPDWPSVLTLNSVISFFAVITKLAFTAALGASISQAKWLWFRQDEAKPLADLQLFDDASRGPWGAITFLFTVKNRHLTCIGAAITVLMLLFDPFLQQVVVYPHHLVPSEKAASIVRAQQYQARSDEGLPLPSVVDMSMKAAIYSGIFDVQNQADIQVEHTCSTGNCTWEGFTSLAVCNKCVDITDHINGSRNSTGGYELSLPNGPTLSGFGGQINSSVTDFSPDLKAIEASIIQFSALISKPMDGSNVTLAWECAMFYCVNQYSTSVRDGEIKQTITETWRNDTATHSQDSDLLYRIPESTNSTFRVASLAAQAMKSFMSQTFTGSGGINDTGSGSAFSSDVIHALYDTTNSSRRIENLAISMTNNIRQQNDSGSAPFSGLALQNQSFVKVRWAWFAYPGAMIVLALLYLLGTIIETTYRDLPIWKSSNMVTLFHGQGMDLYSPPRVQVTTLSEIGKRQNGIKAELVHTEHDGWKFVQNLEG